MNTEQIINLIFTTLIITILILIKSQITINNKTKQTKKDNKYNKKTIQKTKENIELEKQIEGIQEEIIEENQIQTTEETTKKPNNKKSKKKEILSKKEKEIYNAYTKLKKQKQNVTYKDINEITQIDIKVLRTLISRINNEKINKQQNTKYEKITIDTNPEKEKKLDKQNKKISEFVENK